jgi:ABC-2 type transport system permease protein
LNAYLRVVWALTRRAINRVLRRPQLLMPIFLVPTMFLAVTSGGAARAVDLPGFPHVESFFQFAVAGAILQSTLLGGLTVGTTLSFDVDDGFFDRMVVAPVPRSALVLGRLLSGAVIGIAQAALYLAVALLFGAPIEAGAAGITVVMVLAALTAAASGGIAITLALRAHAGWVQGAFPLVFVVIFLSSSFFPRELMTGPARTIADYNPMSFVVEGMREPIVAGLGTGAVLPALLAATLTVAATTTLAVVAMRQRFGAA